MGNLTVSQVANAVGVSIYTINRWYKWFETEDPEKIKELQKKGMPKLPRYKVIGLTNWKCWEEKDIEQLKKFKEFIPNTRGGFMGNVNKKEEN